MTPAEPATLRVSVVYLRPGLSFRRELLLPAPATVGEALAASGVLRQVAELASAQLALGVYGDSRTADDFLRDGDRVEIYRPLTVEPKEARRVRAAVRRRRRAGGSAKTA